MDKLELIVLLFFAIIQVEIITIVVDKVNLKNNIDDLIDLTKRVIDFINKWANIEQEELKTDLEYIMNTNNPYQE